MSDRLTGVSTPMDGLMWEDASDKEHSVFQPIAPDQKIKIFISSICGDNDKYDRIRKRLKKEIETTQLADVYLFESKEASTLTAASHYTLALEDSDVCIFLIDNADGVSKGVQAEADTVKKRKIKSLYYFCDEKSKEKTALEQSLMGASFAKSKTVHKFDDLSNNGAHALVNDIITIYHYYCQRKIDLRQLDEENASQGMNVSDIEKSQMLRMPKSVLKNIDKCKDYVMKLLIGFSFSRLPGEAEKTSDIDEWGVQFFPILFEEKSIKQFNVGMFLETLHKEQTEAHYKVVQIRWQAIQSYFLGDVKRCTEFLETALMHAKETCQPEWVVKDILIDLRNQHCNLDTINNRITESTAQKELSDSSEELYYPVLDRIHESLYEKYIEGLYKKKTESPYSVTLGNDFEQYSELLATSLIVSLYNGSLTHILLFYKKLSELLFYISCKQDGGSFRRDMFKLAVFTRKEDVIKGIRDSYPEVPNNMSADDAVAVLKFCNNHPIKYKRFISQLLAFGAVGYYLNGDDFSYYETYLINEIKDWLNAENPVVVIGSSIFVCLEGISYRLSQDIIADICCMFIDRHYRRWYLDMFKFLGTHLDMQSMGENSAKALIQHVISVLESKDDREQLMYAPLFLCQLRKQTRNLTTELDLKIAEYLPAYYIGTYKLETTEDEKKDFPLFIQEYVQHIQKSNEMQGKNGTYSIGTRSIATVRSLLVQKDLECDDATMDSIISTVADTLLKSKEGISTKLDAVSLLMSIVVKYPVTFKRNQYIYEQLFQKQDEIESTDHSIMSSNVDATSLKIGLQFLFSSMDLDVYQEILELMPLIQGDIATTVSVTNLIAEYLELKDDILLPKKIEALVLQNVLQWLQSNYINIRCHATTILLAMLRSPENSSVVNHQLLNLIDHDCLYIKNLIMRNIYKVEGVTVTTLDYIVAKCENDANYVVRMVCKEEKNSNQTL